MRRTPKIIASLLLVILSSLALFQANVYAATILDASNDGTITGMATLETPYSYLAQPFTPTVSLPVKKVELPLCVTGNPVELHSYVYTGMEIWDFDSVNGKPIKNVIAQSGPINMTEISDCSNGYQTVTFEFNIEGTGFPPGIQPPIPPKLIAGNKYIIAIGTSLFNSTSNTLNWATTDLNPSIGSMFRSTNPSAWFTSWEDLPVTGSFKEYYGDNFASPSLAQTNSLSVNGSATINTSYGLLAQPFTVDESKKAHIVRIPVCNTGNIADLHDYLGAAVNIIEYDDVNNEPVYNIVAQGIGVNMAAIPDCSIGYTMHSAYFPQSPNLVPGKKYSILLQASLFNDPDNTLVWAKTDANNTLGTAFSRPSPAEGNIWTGEDYSLEFDLYLIDADPEPIPEPVMANFVLLATDGMFIKQNVIVNTGDVGVNKVGTAPFLDSSVELSIGNNSKIIDPSSDVYADSLRLKPGSQVNNLYYNDKTGSGQILGNTYNPYDVPFMDSIPSTPSFTAGSLDLTLDQDLSSTLAPGSYRKLVLKKNSVLTLDGGTYNFESIDLKEGAKLLVNSASEIRINGRLSTDASPTIGPNTGSGISASNIKIYVNGINGTTGDLGSTPKAVDFGTGSKIDVNLLAPNGTIISRGGSTLNGAFIGKWIIVGENSTVTLNSSF